MMKKRALIAAVLTASLWHSSVSLAGEVTLNPDGGVSWAAGVDGVEIDWGPTGAIKRIYSKYSTPVEFADRRGISKAQIIAEEKAKGNIIQFMNQSISSTRIVAEVQADINKATQNRETGKTDNVKKVDERVVMESLTEVTTSFAAGNLRGVIVLERGYDEKLQEAWSVVGMSDRTIAASRALSEMNAEKPKDEASSTRSTAGTGAQRTEIRQSKQRDW